MAVRIQVEADAAHAKAAFADIRKSLREAGEEGKAFADIDFSKPELKDLEADLRRIDQQWRELLKVGRGETAAGARAGVSKGAYVDWLDVSEGIGRQYSNADAAERQRANVGRRILNDTRWTPPPPPTPPTPTPHDDGGGGLGGLLGFLGGPIKAAVGFTLAQAGITGGIDAITGHYKDAEREDTMNDDLMRRLHDTTGSFLDLRKQVQGVSDTIHVMQNEGQALTAEWVRLTNTTKATNAEQAVAFAGGVARGFGIAPGAMVSTLGSAAYQGEDPRRFALLIGEAMHQGGQGGQIETVMQALLRWTETASRSGFDHSNVDAFAAMYAGMNATGSPALKGANAEALIGQMNSAFMNGGGGGLAGQILTYNAFRQHGVSNPFETQFRLSEGMFARLPDGTTGFDAVRGQIGRMYGGADKYRRWDAEASYWGISPAQAEQMDRYKPADLQGSQRYLQAAGIDLTKINPSGLADILNAMDPHANLDQMRSSLLGRTGDQALSQADQTALKGASGDALRRLLVQDFGKAGTPKTEGQMIIEASTRFENSMTNAAQTMVVPINALKDQLGSLIGPLMGRIADTLDRAYPKKLDDLSAPGRLVDGASKFLHRQIDDNPLNLMFAHQDGAYEAAPNGVAKFGTIEDGVAADAAQLLRNQTKKGQRSIAQIVRGWDTSPGDAGKLPGYISRVAGRLGIDPNADYDMHAAGHLQALIDAMAPEETGARVKDKDALQRGVNRALGIANPAKPAGGGLGGWHRDPLEVHVKAAPLVVVHQDARGIVLGQQQVPITHVPAPSPAGTKPVQAAPSVPPPAAPKPPVNLAMTPAGY